MVNPQETSIGVLSLLLACEVYPMTHGTGGVDAAEPAAGCPTGLVAVLSDYASTEIALLDADGNPQSESFLSTASTESSGVAFALSGDVRVPRGSSSSGEVVLLDRYGTNVVTWANPRDATVRAQLPVGTGFESNPSDYLEVGAGRAYLARWGDNADPGHEAFDGGGDVLVIDPGAPSIVTRIAMPRADGLPPRPVGLAAVGEAAVVVLAPLSEDFTTAGESSLLGIDPARDAVSFAQPISGLKGCGRPSLSPSGQRLGVACSGQLLADGSTRDPGESGIALYDASRWPPSEIARFDVYDELGSPPQAELEFVDEQRVLGRTQTPLGGEGHNQLFLLDLDAGTFRVLRTAPPGAEGRGSGLVYTDVLCSHCAERCLMADRADGVLHRLAVTPGGVDELDSEPIGLSGLPPIGLGRY